jgi:cytochrome c biogenesis protein CcdA
MINISVRQQRFLKMWAVNFAIGIALVIAVITLLSGLVIGAVMLGNVYGPEAVFGVIFILLGLAFIGGIAGSVTSAKLAILEREEQRTMDALGKDYSAPTVEDDMHTLRNQILAGMRAKAYNKIYGSKGKP